mgnify:CR=1 FL=1
MLRPRTLLRPIPLMWVSITTPRALFQAVFRRFPLGFQPEFENLKISFPAGLVSLRGACCAGMGKSFDHAQKGHSLSVLKKFSIRDGRSGRGGPAQAAEASVHRAAAVPVDLYHRGARLLGLARRRHGGGASHEGRIRRIGGAVVSMQ